MSITPFKPTNVNPQGLTALIRNLGRDCPPHQYLREFLKNSIEACQRTNKNNRHIVCDFNESIFIEQGCFKLCFTDNGDGMTDQQMLSLLNSLSSSGSTTNEHQNYGVGAKISAMTRNQAGILYESWRDGKGFSVLIRYQEEEDTFGIQGFNVNGQTLYALPVDTQKRPPIIEDHGTRVTLFGMSPIQDTMLPPDGIKSPRESWIGELLNLRFFRLPSDINIQTRIGYTHHLSSPDKSFLKQVVGYQAALNQQSQSCGILDLPDAKAFWWIHKQDSNIQGHTALINQGEIFDRKEPWQNTLAPFGIIIGRNRISIYIEPNKAEQNTPRTALVKHDGSPLSWEGWHQFFRDNMPKEIEAFMEELLNETSQKSHATNIRQRLKSLMELFILSGYKPIPLPSGLYKLSNDPTKPSQMVGVETLEGGKTDVALDSEGQNEADEPEDNLMAENDTQQNIKTAGEDNEELLPAEDELNLFPKVEWTNEEKSPQIDGMAAEYIHESHIILANRDFKGFTDLITYFNHKYSDSSEVQDLILNSVNEGIEQALMESVAGFLSLKESHERWSNEDQVKKALSMQALTTTVMQRYWMVNYIDRSLKEKIIAIS